jgi:hypothetical protein
MAGPGPGRDRSSHDPTDNFAGSGAAHFGSFAYPIDSELTTMSASYNLPSYGRPMEDGTSSINIKDQTSMNAMDVDTNGAAAASVVDPAMAPPQTPSQPMFPPAGSRPSLDASIDAGREPQTGDKRKRSKASRACDQCRRKKVPSIHFAWCLLCTT